MGSTSETGHAKNVANFATLIQFCTGYGSSYNPSKSSILITALNTKLASAETALNELSSLIPIQTLAVNNRDIVFSPLSKLVTRVFNAVEASDVSKLFIEDVKTIVRKLQGRRAKAVNKTPLAEGEEPPKTHSVSQMSFDSRIENFQNLIDLLAAEPGYNPNETELTVASLSTLLNQMKTVNQEVITSEVPIKNSRINRDNILYVGDNSLVALANDVKKYVKSLFGPDSSQFKQISKLQFTKYKSD